MFAGLVQRAHCAARAFPLVIPPLKSKKGFRAVLPGIALCGLSLVSGCGGSGGGSGESATDVPPRNTVEAESESPSYYVVTHADALFVQEDEDGNMFLGPKPPPKKDRTWSSAAVLSNAEHDASNISTALSVEGRAVITWIESADKTENGTAQPALHAAVYDMPSTLSTDALMDAQIHTNLLSDPSASVRLAPAGQAARASVEIVAPAAKLAMHENGTSFVAWVQGGNGSDGAENNTLHFSVLPAGEHMWQGMPGFDSASGQIEAVELLPLANGNVLIVWRESESVGNHALMGRIFLAQSAAYGAPFVLANNVSATQMPVLWTHEDTPFFAVVLGDADHTMVTGRIGLEAGSVTLSEPIGGAGEKAAPQAAVVNDQHILVWLEEDSYGYWSAFATVSAVGSEQENLQAWQSPQLLEVSSGHLSQLQLATDGEGAQVFWTNIDEAVYGNLYATAFDGSQFLEPVLLHELGADTPAADYDDAGRVYVLWRALHNHYLEFHPEDGWRSAKREFCAQRTFGLCYEGGREQSIAVSANHGIAAWRERQGQTDVVALSINILTTEPEANVMDTSEQQMQSPSEAE